VTQFVMQFIPPSQWTHGRGAARRLHVAAAEVYMILVLYSVGRGSNWLYSPLHHCEFLTVGSSPHWGIQLLDRLYDIGYKLEFKILANCKLLPLTQETFC